MDQEMKTYNLDFREKVQPKEIIEGIRERLGYEGPLELYSASSEKAAVICVQKRNGQLSHDLSDVFQSNNSQDLTPIVGFGLLYDEKNSGEENSGEKKVNLKPEEHYFNMMHLAVFPEAQHEITPDLINQVLSDIGEKKNSA